MSNKLKKSFSNAVYKKPIATSIAISTVLNTAFFTGIMMDKKEYELDNFFSSETISEVFDLNDSIANLNSKYIDLNQDIISGNPNSSGSVENLDDKLNTIDFEKTQIVYDILTSPISEEETKQIITSYNGMEVGQRFPITGLNNFDTINDIKSDLKPNENSTSFTKEIEYIDDFKQMSNRIEKVRDESVLLVASMYFVLTGLTAGMILPLIQISKNNRRPNIPKNLKVEPTKSNKPKRKKLKSLGV